MSRYLSIAGIVSLAAAALAATSSAQTGTGPTISGIPDVGETLTSNTVGDSGLYRWQRCDPVATVCDQADAFDDGDWQAIDNAHGQDFRAYTLTAADVGLMIRVIAKGTSTGQQWLGSNLIGPVIGVPAINGDVPPPPGQDPTPEHGVKLIGEPVGGTVPKVKVPGSRRYVPITEVTEIPVGSIIDTRGEARIKMTAATGGFGSTAPDESIEFYGGLFKIVQPAVTNATATARLVEKLACNGVGNGVGNGEIASASDLGPIARSAAKRRRRMWGSGSGSYATAGKGGTGSVRGTTWLTKDTCKGTLFWCTEGHGITVFDKAKRKRLELGPGDKYFARFD